MRLCSIVVAQMLCVAAAASAQTGSLVGSVVSDSAGHAIAAAEVRIPSLDVGRVANYAGEFRIDNVPAGRVIVSIRRIGFRPLLDTVTIVAGQMVQRDFILTRDAVTLDSVRVTATERFISPALRGFAEREKQGFGHFIDDSVLRKNDDHTLADILGARVPGLVIKRDGREAYVSSSRAFSASSSGAAFGRGNTASTSKCWATIYVDGVRVYDPSTPPIGRTDHASMPPDMNEFQVNQFAGVEFYGGGAAVPAEFNKTSNGCGVLLLWTREK